MKRAIVTGPTGAVGMALIQELAANQIEVYAIVNPNSTRASRIAENDLVHKITCDISQLDALTERIHASIDVFFHLAWRGTTGEARNDMFLQNQNIADTLLAVKIANKLGCRTFVGAGSQAEYGRVQGKVAPDTPVKPENGYGFAKLCSGQMSRVMCQQLGMKHCWTRILSVYGPYDGANSMVMSVIRNLLQEQKVSCTLGEQEWDYCYSSDVGKALFLVATKGKDGAIYCIGSGHTRKLADYINVMKNQIDDKVSIGWGDIPYAEKQVMYLCADVETLYRDTGYVSVVSFEQGIDKTIQWYRKYLSEERK